MVMSRSASRAVVRRMASPMVVGSVPVRAAIWVRGRPVRWCRRVVVRWAVRSSLSRWGGAGGGGGGGRGVRVGGGGGGRPSGGGGGGAGGWCRGAARGRRGRAGP